MDDFIKLRKQVMEKEFGTMNDKQKKAVFHTEGPLLVLAGAGSGKTTVLVNRIANIVQYGSAYTSPYKQNTFTDEDARACQGYLDKGAPLSDDVKARLAVSPCPAWRVMAITFTNKAAGELKERLVKMLGEEGREIWASTFHSSCARILRRDADAIGYNPNFTIYDTDDSMKLMTECLKELDISKESMKPRAALSEISRAKDQLLTPKEYEQQNQSDFRLGVVAKVYKLYQRKLKERDAMDFDDLLVNTVRLFQNSKETLSYYQGRFRYIMVDEYQDTNHVQYEFVNLLAGGHENLCVVGDDDQSIYKFRGATIENILNFEEDHPGAEVIRLEQNYRSTQTILDAANAVIENNTNRKGKNLWTSRGEGEKIVFHVASDAEDEASCIAERILDGAANGRKYSDYAILYRMNAQSAVFERSFVKQGIPHRLLGGTRFYERQEVKDMLAYLSVVNNPDDIVRMRRIINQPKRGIGLVTVDKAVKIVEDTGIPFLQVISTPEQYKDLSRSAGKLREFAKMIHYFIDINQNPKFSLNDLYREILDKTGYIKYLKENDPEKGQERAENVQELSSNIQLYQEMSHEDDKWFPDDESGEEEKSQLTSFLEEVSLIADIDNYDAESDAVTLMTIHSAKGLEFPCVILPGLEEGIFPGFAVQYNPAEAEEERRLAYVALTRAEESLYISSAETRMLFGNTSRNPVSRFVGEIPEELLEKTRSGGYSFGGNRSFTSGQEKPLSFGSGIKTSAPENQDKDLSVGGYKKRPPARKSAGTYAAGDTVSHKTFGTGLVLTATPMANDTLLEIAFDKVGTKKIFANFAKLEKH